MSESQLLKEWGEFIHDHCHNIARTPSPSASSLSPIQRENQSLTNACLLPQINQGDRGTPQACSAFDSHATIRSEDNLLCLLALPFYVRVQDRTPSLRSRKLSRKSGNCHWQNEIINSTLTPSYCMYTILVWYCKLGIPNAGCCLSCVFLREGRVSDIEYLSK